ncbi:Rad1/Rec1/Rad17 [Myxozyma melibiosi]|uniref:Rad1/Rec1/Rad17 n=1 Tax=Myxozyma melibiosi TaxID=54550 RepID=A0ABR1EYH8_9ASCO
MVELSQPPPVLDAVSTCVSFIYRILNTLGRVSRRATVSIAAEGITVSVESSKACQAHVFLDRAFFSTYLFNPPHHPEAPPGSYTTARSTSSDDDSPSVAFSIQLDALIECFQIFGSESTAESGAGRMQIGGRAAGGGGGGGGDGDSERRQQQQEQQQKFLGSTSVCKLRYNYPGDPFLLMLDEGSLTTTCEFTTSTELDEISDIILSSDALHLNVIMKPASLLESFRELDTPSTSEPTLTVSARKNASSGKNSTGGELELACTGELGTVAWLVTTRDHRNVIENFVMSDQIAHLTHSYAYSMFQKVREAVRLATLISLRVDEDGIMSIQSMCDIGDGRKGFVDFRFLPVEGDGADAEDDYDRERAGNVKTQTLTERIRRTQKSQAASGMSIFDSSDNDDL